MGYLTLILVIPALLVMASMGPVSDHSGSDSAVANAMFVSAAVIAYLALVRLHLSMKQGEIAEDRRHQGPSPDGSPPPGTVARRVTDVPGRSEIDSTPMLSLSRRA